MADPNQMFPVSTDTSKGNTKPFKTTGGDGAKQSAEEKPAAPAGKGIVSSKASGNPLPTPAQQQQGVAHGHSADLGFPPAQNGPKPFKI